MPYEGSQNYIWSTRLLGKGTSGNVFLGYHKKTANKCAVKVFKANAGHHAERELELMRTLDHKNIVKVLAVESSARSSERVLILEYCNHGNLFNLLRKPVYIFGLPEKEVVNFLVQMGDVMKYLHTKGIIHRDWKPGNIMCCRERGAGRLMFKVGDFGTARTLEEDSEDFSTLHGTVEYLHPIMLKDMIERKDIKKTGGSYSTKSDLWSFGATLYQVATGQLPFVVARGRRDTQGMSEMTLEKPDDAIAGLRNEDGETQWKQHLPDTCRLSQFLRVFLEKMFRSLMQKDLAKVPTFPQFFKTVDDFSERIVIYMFSVITCTHHHLYLKPSERLSHVKEAIAQLTEVRAADQILILDSHFLDETVEESWEIVSYPATSADNPIILLAPEIQIDMLWITVKISPRKTTSP